MFLEASVYQVKRVPEEERQERFGLLVLVMRQWPRGIPGSLVHRWIKDAGPSLETLTALRQGLLSAEEFAWIYAAEQQEQQQCRVRSYVQLSHSDGRKVTEQSYACSPLSHLRFLEQLYGKVTLLCWEPGPPCHRYVLLQELQRPATRRSLACQTEKNDPHREATSLVPDEFEQRVQPARPVEHRGKFRFTILHDVPMRDFDDAPWTLLAGTVCMGNYYEEQVGWFAVYSSSRTRRYDTRSW
jgi:uncharacterized protein YeaO (DUF488 family)